MMHDDWTGGWGTGHMSGWGGVSTILILVIVIVGIVAIVAIARKK